MSVVDGYRLFDNDFNRLLAAVRLKELVFSGLSVSQKGAGPDMSVDVASGSAWVNGVFISKSSVTNVLLAASNPTYPRKSIITMTSGGTITETAGVSEAADPSDKSGPYTKVPKPPDIPSNRVILGEIWVGAGVTAIYDADITDRRVLFDKVKISQIDPSTEVSRVRAYLGTAQDIPSGVWTKVNLDVKHFDTLDEYDNVTNYRFTATKAGYYLVIAAARFNVGVDQKIYAVRIYRNGAAGGAYDSRSSSGTGTVTPRGIDVINLAIDDYIELWVYHNVGADSALVTGSTGTYLVVHRWL